MFTTNMQRLIFSHFIETVPFTSFIIKNKRVGRFSVHPFVSLLPSKGTPFAGKAPAQRSISHVLSLFTDI